MKQGIVTSAEQVTLSSQVAGRVSSIAAKIGKKVTVDQLLLTLVDTNGTISFGAKKAAVGLESARDSYNQTQLNLNKSLFDSQIGFQKNQI